MKVLEQNLRARLAHDDLPHLLALLQQFKERGGTSDCARRVLEMLREEQSVAYLEDRVLELLDVATRFCSQKLRIWEENSK